MKAQHNVQSLPKWAQEMITELRNEPRHVTGANIEGVHVEMYGFKHDENSAAAITSIANALAENAKALGKLSDALMPEKVTANFDIAIRLSDIKGK